MRSASKTGTFLYPRPYPHSRVAACLGGPKESFMNRKGFTLIELLVVIAIIAILAAILFPVFGRVREQVRQSQCMTQMHQIDVAVKQFYEDNGKYPASLYGFAEIRHSANQLPSFVTATGSNLQSTSQMYYKPLFNKQKLLNDNAIFLCPDTRDKTQAGPGGTATTQLVTNAVYPSMSGIQSGNYTWTLFMWRNLGRDRLINGIAEFNNYNGKSVYFYKADNYDVQPKPNATLDGPDTSGAYEVHYALDWTGTSSDPTGAAIKAENAKGIYTNQLKYGRLCDDSHTVVTWCSDHLLNAGSDKVILLTLGGATKAVDKKTFYNAGSKQGPLFILK